MVQRGGRRSQPADIKKDLFGSGVLVCDGAMGTMLQAAGVPLDVSLSELSLTRPELVKAIHGAYIAAGANVIETNTFGACTTRLGRHGIEGSVVEINRASARIAREAADAAETPVLVAGSVGPATPAGSRGRVSNAVLREAFREQIGALAEGGVDLIVFETFGSLSELLEAIGASQEVAPNLPMVAQMTFLEDGKTLAGETPAEVATKLDGIGLAALGANCTHGPQGLLEILLELSQHTDLPLAAQPNAGSPTFVDGKFQYATDPAYLGRYAARYVQAGAAFVGGCCGTTPAHVEAVAAAVRGMRPPTHKESGRRSRGHTSVTETASNVQPSNLLRKLASNEFTVIGELGPPTGGGVEEAVRDAEILRDDGAAALLIGTTNSPRAQVSPTSLAVLVQQRLENLEAILTVATWEKSAMSLQADLLGAYAFGVRHVVCRTGTPPLQGDYPNAGGFWDVDSVELIQLLRGLNAGLDRHGIPLAQPTAFVVGSRINPGAEDLEREIEESRRKIEAGLDFIITPPVYDVDALERLMDAAKVPADLPVLLGVMPLRDFNHADFLQHEVPGVLIPDEVLDRMWRARDDAPAEGVRVAMELMARARTSEKIRGVVLTSSVNDVDELGRLMREAGS